MSVKVLPLVLTLAACGTAQTGDLVRGTPPNALFFTTMNTLVIAAGVGPSACKALRAGQFDTTATLYFWLSPPPRAPGAVDVSSGTGQIFLPKGDVPEPLCGTPLVRGTLELTTLEPEVTGRFLRADVPPPLADVAFDAAPCDVGGVTLPDLRWVTDCGG